MDDMAVAVKGRVVMAAVVPSVEKVGVRLVVVVAKAIEVKVEEAMEAELLEGAVRAVENKVG